MPITTPCIKVCARDAASGVCFGCGRIGPEIAHWFRLTEAERAAILAALPARLAAFGLPPGGDREQGMRVAREQRLGKVESPAATGGHDRIERAQGDGEAGRS